ncbi:MAG: hypothetical protein JWN70_2892 [Planctomycetaceae bacterium]|nr:hypothetical protein [Planctomycetaceae bacterium]
MNDEVANPNQLDATTSRDGIDVAVMITAILATHFVTGGYRPDPFTWLYLPACAAIGWALSLHFDVRRTSTPSPTARAFIHGHMLIILALSILVVGARLGFPFASHADAPSNQMHRVLSEIVLWLGSILTVIAVFFPILSRTARLSPIFWLAIALTLVLASTTASRSSIFF